MTAAALPPRLKVEVEMAANGHVSGVLGEWPLLRLASEHLGLPACQGMPAAEVRAQARVALGR